MVCGEERMKLTWKIYLLIIILVFSLLSIFGFPPHFFQKGVIITSVETNSTAFEEGLRQGQIIIGVDGKIINNLDDFSKAVQGKYLSNKSIKTIFNTKNSEAILFSKDAPESLDFRTV
ncbi:MAG: PDZ domain-containing protein [Candidatus Pacearchaeota archaeon]|nr:PDZ domain-containing protein [Candidatus Pacearchaeota archaeon]